MAATNTIARLEAEIIRLEQKLSEAEDYIKRMESDSCYAILVDMGFGGFGDN